jgi:hypothetical protein
LTIKTISLVKKKEEEEEEEEKEEGRAQFVP